MLAPPCGAIVVPIASCVLRLKNDFRLHPSSFLSLGYSGSFRSSVFRMNECPPLHPLWKRLHQEADQFIKRCYPCARKSASKAVFSRIQFTLHATRPTPHGASRLVQAVSAGSVKTRRAPSRHWRHARVYGHTTTAIYDMSTPPPTTLAGDVAVACVLLVDLQSDRLPFPFFSFWRSFRGLRSLAE